ncbi:unnamed protein product [Paramecium sonneborni]|uniref:RRM domain-containing protein n=1 Tax=Paramecium sonneborni TaxID=65129 RepID=A0A8S1KZ16_9CILI|nr:unnamed protein product [Paramecium sonneborni]
MGDIIPNQLFVAGYSRSKVEDDKDVRDIFKKYGMIKEVAYKGSYSFVTFNTEQEAQEALKGTNGQTYNGQKLKVDVVDNRKGRKTGPNEEDKCFKCNKGGLVIVQIINHQDVVEDVLILDQSAVIEDLNQDHILLIHHPDLEEEDIKTKERDTVEAQEEIKEIEKEVLVQKDHLLTQFQGRIQTQNLDKEWEKKLILLQKKYKHLIEYNLFNSSHKIIIMKKRTLQDLSEEQDQINQSYVEINSVQRELYLENQKRLREKQKEKDNIVIIEDDELKQQQIEEDEVQLSFPIGKFCLNCLTQYPIDDRQPQHLPFINILYENAFIDVKTQKPKKTLESALMTCYGFEDELLEPIVKSGVQLYIVNDNDNLNKRLEIIEKYNNYPNWMVIKPSKLGSSMFGGAFHPKIWILKFPKFIRIVIGSQNLHVGDWTIWSQAMWIQDFKLGKSELDQTSQEFKTMLREFLFEILPTSHKFEDLLKIKYDEYDFKDVNIRLITSIPGRFVGNQLFKYGMTRLQSVLFQELCNNKMDVLKQVCVTYQTTSIGQIDNNYVDFALQCCTGKVYKQPLPSEQNNKKLNQMILNQQEEEQSKLKLIYPTADYVENQTHGGVDFANPLYLKKQLYENPKFPKHLFHKYQGSDHYYWHTGNIPHLKVMIITTLDEDINDYTSIYIGSHNFSQGAWGKMEKNATQLYIANTELGVLYPPKKNSALMKQQIIEQLSFKFPPLKYEKDDQPWINEAYYEKLYKEYQQQIK